MVLGAGGVEPRPYGGQEDLCKPGVGRADVGIGPYGGVARSAVEGATGRVTPTERRELIILIFRKERCVWS